MHSHRFSASASGDHGAFNSWDRLPYITEVRDGKTPSTIPAVNDVHNNFIVANYAADGGCLDNDDGSSYYDIREYIFRSRGAERFRLAA
jgi:hypothetical protein